MAAMLRHWIICFFLYSFLILELRFVRFCVESSVYVFMFSLHEVCRVIVIGLKS